MATTVTAEYVAKWKILTTKTAYRKRNKIDNIPLINVKHTSFKKILIPSTVIE